MGRSLPHRGSGPKGGIENWCAACAACRRACQQTRAVRDIAEPRAVGCAHEQLKLDDLASCHHHQEVQRHAGARHAGCSARPRVLPIPIFRRSSERRSAAAPTAPTAATSRRWEGGAAAGSLSPVSRATTHVAGNLHLCNLNDLFHDIHPFFRVATKLEQRAITAPCTHHPRRRLAGTRTACPWARPPTRSQCACRIPDQPPQPTSARVSLASQVPRRPRRGRTAHAQLQTHRPRRLAAPVRRRSGGSSAGSRQFLTLSGSRSPAPTASPRTSCT